MKFLLFILLFTSLVFADQIVVDAAAGRKPISPLLFGRNNSLSDDPSRPVSATDWELYRDAGVRLFRENGGNNSTKYNWERKLSSHPDWYNNVYKHDWDYTATSLQQNMPSASGMFAFQLVGWAAKTSSYNFNDWGYNNSQWWEGVRNNWAGGGGPTQGDGNPELYLEPWPPEATVGILTHWFGAGGLGLEPAQFRYWNMDNEAEIWDGTHDDVMPVQLAAEEFMQIYFETAKKARAAFPDIKLLGPTPANEWQWYNWKNDKISYKGKNYVWLEYFIKRIGEEQQTSGVRLLDVLDVHFYPGESNARDIVNLHRIWFDKEYTYPGANGVKRTGSGGWSDAIRQEYLFARCRAWLEQHLGADHGISLGVTEMGINGDNPNATAVWYASTLGVFMDEGVKIFTPWSWKIGMWEVLHLFSRYSKKFRVEASTKASDTINAYSSVNTAGDSLTIFLVNRDTQNAQTAEVSLNAFKALDGEYDMLSMSNLPSLETFKSHTNNALQPGIVSVSNLSFSIELSKLSVATVLLTGNVVETSVEQHIIPADFKMVVYPNPFNPATTIAYTLNSPAATSLTIYDIRGRLIQTMDDLPATVGSHIIPISAESWPSGLYLFHLRSGSQSIRTKAMLMR